MGHALPDQVATQTECAAIYCAYPRLVAKFGYRPAPRILGGEIAAEKLTGYLKPERITIYVDGKPDKLILANRLRPDVNGEIEILETFWAIEEARQRNDVAPPLLVYADLMATTDPRNIETAKLIRDHHLTQVRHAD